MVIGTAFDCPGSSNRINLFHSQFSGEETADCTNEAISGVGISVDTSGAEPCYTSELSVNISANMEVTELGLSSFTVNWMKSTSDCGTSFSYDVVSDCGGSCSVISSSSRVCNGWTAPQNCSVMVRANSLFCSGLTGSFSTPVMLNLTGE